MNKNLVSLAFVFIILFLILSTGVYAFSLSGWLKSIFTGNVVSESSGDGLNATYFDSKGFRSINFSRIDPKIDFIWGDGKPHDSIYPNTFSILWNGYIEPRYSENYTFYAYSDEGVRVYINNIKVVDDWSAHAARERSGSIYLEGGKKHSIKVEYYEDMGNAALRLFWSSQSQEKEIVPQSQLYSSLQSSSSIECSSFTYSNWSECVNGMQTRSVASSSPSGCSGGNPELSQTCTISTPTPPIQNVTCTDSDGGIDYYIKGTAKGDEVLEDFCVNSIKLSEALCNNDGREAYAQYDCPYGCKEGACLQKTELTKESACKDFVNQVKSPSSMDIYGHKLDFNWNSYYPGEAYINGAIKKYNGYLASWSTNDNYEGKSSYLTITYEVMVFEDVNIDLSKYLEGMTSYGICIVDSFWGTDNKENKVYVCNWNVFRNKPQINYASNYRNLYWYNGNVLVQGWVYQGETITTEEAMLASDIEANDLIQGIKDNSFKYVEWTSFSINPLLYQFVSDSLSKCSSDLTSPIRPGTNETCYPSWQCKLEPLICPEYGLQKRICIDYSCDQKREEQISCSPGICSGCYVPKWFGGNENKCIPYGFRFSAQSGESIRLVEGSSNEILTVNNVYRDPIYLSVGSDTNATLTIRSDLQNYSYYLVEGKSVDITDGIKALYGDGQRGESFLSVIIYVNDIVYQSEESYVDVRIDFKQNTLVVDTFNAYCEIDGNVKPQKTKDYNGDWASCQNNYECESNFCSAGECIEITEAIKQSKGAKALLFRVLCRLANILDNEDYTSCIQKYVL